MRERPILVTADMVRALLAGRKTQTRRVIVGPPDNRFWVGASLVGSGPRNRYRPAPYSGYYQAERWWVGRHPVRGWWALDDPAGPSEALVAATIRDGHTGFPCRYGEPGDLLWVRETWASRCLLDGLPPCAIPGIGRDRIWYLADGPKPDWAGRTRSPIHMPRWASRLTLEITDIHAERLQDIGETAARAEGVERWATAGLTGWMPYNDDALSPADYEIWRNACVKRTALASFISLWNSIHRNRGDYLSWDHNPWVWVISFRRVTETEAAREL